MLPSFSFLWHSLFVLFVPSVLAELGWMTMGIVDTIMVGHQRNSAVAIGAVSLSSILHYVVAIFGTGLMLGLDTLVSQSYGAADLDDTRRSLISGVYLSLGLAPILMGIVSAWGTHRQNARYSSASHSASDSLPGALNWGTLPLLLYFAFRRYLQGVNLVKPVTFSLISANIVNFVGNGALIYGHWGGRAMGTVGSGWSTCWARLHMALVLMGYYTPDPTVIRAASGLLLTAAFLPTVRWITVRCDRSAPRRG